MDITGKTRLMGLLGSNIAYTLSPAIHNFSAKRLGLDVVYVPFDLQNKDIKTVLDMFWQLGVVGFNVTTPYKKAVAEALPLCGINSVNTVFRTDAGWAGASTDGEGFARALSRLGGELKQYNKVVILGAGGAVSALLAYMSNTLARMPDISVLRRRSDQDVELKKAVSPKTSLSFFDFEPKAFSGLLDRGGAETLVIQATCAPNHGDDLSSFLPGLKNFKGHFVDLIYGTPSALYKSAKSHGIPCQDGLPMLVEQARLSQQLWWKRSADFDDIVKHLASR